MNPYQCLSMGGQIVLIEVVHGTSDELNVNTIILRVFNCFRLLFYTV